MSNKQISYDYTHKCSNSRCYSLGLICDPEIVVHIGILDNCLYFLGFRNNALEYPYKQGHAIISIFHDRT